MATGEKRFSTRSLDLQKNDFPPITPGDYTLRIRGDKTEVKKSSDPNSAQLPYVNTAFTVVGSALKEGGKDRMVFHRFFLAVKPSEKGVIMPARPDQLKGLAMALGEDIDLPFREYHNNKTGEMEECIDASAFARWLKENDGRELQGHIKTEVAKAEDKQRGYKDRDVVAYFIETEQPTVSEDEAAEEDEEVEEEVEEDEEPAPPPAKKPAKKGKR